MKRELRVLPGENLPAKDCPNELAPSGQEVLSNQARSFQVRQVQESLRESRKRLEALGFLASHEIPDREGSGFQGMAFSGTSQDDLTALVGAAAQQMRQWLQEVETLLRASAQDPGVLTSDAFAEIAASGKAAEAMVDELVACQRAGQIPVFPLRASLAEVVRQLMSDAVAEHPERQIEWVIRPLPEIVADPSLIDAALRALTAYALTQSRMEHPARIEIMCQEAEAEVRVGLRYNDSRGAKGTQEVPSLGRLAAGEDAAGAAVAARLATASAAAHRHGGRIWTESSGGQVTLWLSIPKTLPLRLVS